MDIKLLDQTYIAPTYARFPVTLVRGAGAKLWDDAGKEYIDMGSGIAVSSFGSADEEWIKAVEAQLHALPHTSNLYYTEPCARLAQMLCERTGLKKVFFGNSGAEANECAIKAARRRAKIKYGDHHYTIVTLNDSFHGRTLATLAATGQESFHQDFGPFPEGFVSVSNQDAEEFDRLTDETPCAAVMLEIVQGESGVRVLSESFVKRIAEIAQKKDILVICDEVQTGNGRTGRLYSYMNVGISPDIVTTAKGLGGGLPIGCCMLGEKAESALSPGTHGSTFGGNPVCCAGAISILSRLTEDFLTAVREKGEYLTAFIPGLSGMGLMLGMDVKRPVGDVLAALREKGVLALSAHGRLRLLPPLNIEWDELKKAAEIIKKETEA